MIGSSRLSEILSKICMQSVRSWKQFVESVNGSRIWELFLMKWHRISKNLKWASKLTVNEYFRESLSLIKKNLKFNWFLNIKWNQPKLLKK